MMNGGAYRFPPPPGSRAATTERATCGNPDMDQCFYQTYPNIKPYLLNGLCKIPMQEVYSIMWSMIQRQVNAPDAYIRSALMNVCAQHNLAGEEVFGFPIERYPASPQAQFRGPSYGPQHGATAGVPRFSPMAGFCPPQHGRPAGPSTWMPAPSCMSGLGPGLGQNNLGMAAPSVTSSQSSATRREEGYVILELNHGAVVKVPDFILHMTRNMMVKEALIGLVVEFTSPEVHGKFLSFRPDEQYAIALSFFLHPTVWQDFSTAFGHHLELYHLILTTNPDSVFRGPLPKKETPLVVVHVFAGMPTSMVAVRAACHILGKDDPTSAYRIIAEHCVPLSNLGLRFTEDLVKRSQFGNVTVYPDCGQFAEAWPKQTADLISTGQVCFVMNFPGMENILQDGRGAHDPSLRAFWKMHRLMVETSVACGGRVHYVVQFERDDGQNPELTSRLMNAVQVNALNYKRPPRPRFIYCSIPQFQVRRWTLDSDPQESLNGWTWTGREVGESISVKCPVIELTPQVVDYSKQSVFAKAEPLSIEEHAALQALRARHVATGTLGLVPRSFFLDWMGCTPSMKQLWETAEMVSPCLPFIIGSTGGSAVPGATYAENCGKNRYCVNCEEMNKFIVSSSFCQVQVDILGTVLQAMASSNKFENNLKIETIHDCASNCPFNPRPGH